MREMFGWWTAKHQLMDELKYVLMGFGAQCVITVGTPEMLQLYVDN